MVLFCAPFIGGVTASPWAESAVHRMIFWHIRVPRVMAGLLAGWLLSRSGMLFQILFRNELATPYTLGVAGGASLGVAIYAHGFLALPFFLAGSVTASIAGAFCIVLLVMSFGSAVRYDISSLLLGGFALSYCCGAGIVLIQYMGTNAEIGQVVRWMMGRLSGCSWNDIIFLCLTMIILEAMVFLLRHEIRLLLLGDALAHSRGVSVIQMRKIMIMAASIMVAAVVAVCGPIGFVGLIVPALSRRLFTGKTHYALFICGPLGGLFLIACDALSRLVHPTSELPVGIITALIGCPFFLFMLWLHRRRT